MASILPSCAVIGWRFGMQNVLQKGALMQRVCFYLPSLALLVVACIAPPGKNGQVAVFGGVAFTR